MIKLTLDAKFSLEALRKLLTLFSAEAVDNATFSSEARGQHDFEVFFSICHLFFVPDLVNQVGSVVG